RSFRVILISQFIAIVTFALGAACAEEPDSSGTIIARDRARVEFARRRRPLWKYHISHGDRSFDLVGRNFEPPLPPLFLPLASPSRRRANCLVSSVANAVS